MRCVASRLAAFAAVVLMLATGLLAPAAAAQDAPAPGGVVINEILYDPPPDGSPGEYVELFNRSGQSFDLSGFEIADSRDAPTPVTGAPTTLAPGAYAVLVQDGDAFAAAFPGVPFVEPESWPQLNNGGDTAQLLFAGTVIDAVPYEPGWGGEDVALERIDPAGPSGDASNFGSSTAEIGTPGAENTLAGGPGDTMPPALESVVVAEGGVALTAVFSEALAPASVAASAFAVEAAAGAAPAVTEALPAAEAPARVELTLSGELAAGTYTLVVEGVADEAGNVLDEGSVNFTVASGTVPDPRAVVVNELWYAPETTELEFVELFNRTDEAFDLLNFLLADERRDPTLIDAPLLGPERTLEPGEYTVLVRDEAAFGTRFPDVEADVVEVSPWPALNNGGDASVLLFSDGGGREVEIDAVPFEPSWGGSESASLERIDPAGPSDDPDNFGTSTAPRGATPGVQNAIFAGGPDETPPVLDSVAVAASRVALTAFFSEPLAPASVSASDFEIEAEAGAAPEVAGAFAENDPARVEIALSGEIESGTYTLVARDVADEAGNVLDESRVPFTVAPGGVPVPGEVVVNELWYAPEDADLEFVEVYNHAGEAFDVSRFALADDRRAPVPVADAAALLEPGGYAVFARDSAAFAGRFPGVSFVEVSPWPALNNGGDAAVLFFGSGEERVEIDGVPYRPGWGGSDTTSLERIDPAGPSADAANFGSSTAPAGATPGAQNAIFMRDLSAPRPVFAREVLEGAYTFAVVFSEPLDAVSVEAADFEIGGRQPDSARVAGDDGQRVELFFGRAPGGATLTARGVADLTGNVLTESVSVEVAFVAASFEGRPPGSLVVNEILYDPLADAFDERPDQPEYVEVHNPTDRRLALESYYLTNRVDENGESDSLAVGRARASVAPGGFAVIYAGGGGPLEAAFPETDFADSSSVTLLPVARASLGLTNGGELVALRRPDGALLDSVFYRPEWHSPAAESGDGRALERIDPAGRSNSAANWTTATAASGGTPGRPNGAVPPPPGEAPAAGVEVVPSPFSPNGDGVDDVAFIRYALDAPVSLARLRIYDSMGREVYEREAALAGREGQLPWDGRAEDGSALRMGIYVVLFEALDAAGGATEAFKEAVVLARPLN